ncbi:MAG TPA: heme-degrading domain-containing protein [Bryobacteraceae bacterium]|nr:heme-degrading domain-containing protein [Bryobacteraceae bacterium]
MATSDDLAAIALQERTLQFRAFNEDDAWNLGSRIRNASRERSFPLVIDIRHFSRHLFFSTLPGSTPDNVEWARRKANVVQRFHRSSYGMGLDLEHRKVTLLDRFGLALNDYAAHGGSFPLSILGTGVIGSITVSGLPQREDHEFVVEMLCAELERNYAELKLR